MSTSISDSIERSIFTYKIESNIDFSEIKNVIEYISSLRNNNSTSILLNTGIKIQSLFLSNNGTISYKNFNTLWIKFGWARRSGLPEMLDARTGRTEILRLPSGIYLYEPTHFLIFEYNSNIILLHEYNMFAPRPKWLCYYIVEFYKRMIGNLNAKIRIQSHLIFTKNIEKILKEYDAVKSITMELQTSNIKTISKVLG